MHARYHFYFWKFAQSGENIFGGAFLFDFSIILLLFFILNYFTDTHKFWANFCPKVNLCDDFEEKDVNTKNNWEILEVLFIIGILVRWSFRKYFTILWYATLPSNGTAAWLMDKTETIQGKSGHEYLVHTLLGFRIIIRQTFLVLIFQKWETVLDLRKISSCKFTYIRNFFRTTGF